MTTPNQPAGRPFPQGGAQGDVLTKLSDENQDIAWAAPGSIGAGGSISATDGTVTVDPATSLSFPPGSLTDAGGGVAAVALPVLRRTVTLTHAEIITLRFSPVEIVPNPGAGKLVDFIRIYLVSSIIDPYTGIDVGADLLINLVDFPIGFVSNDSAYDSGLLNTLFGSSSIIAVSSALDPVPTASGTTQPIVSMFAGDLGALLLGLDQAAELQDGNADNTLQVTTVYTVIDLL